MTETDTIHEVLRQLMADRDKMHTLPGVLKRYSLGYFTRMWGVMGLEFFTIFVEIEGMPDADYPEKRTVGRDQKFVVHEQIHINEVLSAIKIGPECIHHMLQTHLRNIWMRVAKHEFDEWLRLDGVRVFDPHGLRAVKKSTTSADSLTPQSDTSAHSAPI